MRNLRRPLALGILLGLSAGAAADTITFVDGRKAKGNVRVSEEKLDKVEYRDPNIRQMQSVDSEVVADVEYENVPESFAIAQDALANGAFETAGKMFLGSVEDIRNKGGLAARARYLAGEAFRQGGYLQDALEAYDSLIEADAKSRYVPMATLGRGQVLLRQKETAKAKAVFEKLKTFGERWTSEADLRLLSLDEKMNATARIEEYKRLIAKTSTKYPQVANQAKLLIGKSLIANQQFDEARSYFEGILERREGSSRDVVAGAWNGLGAALMGVARKGQGDAALYKEALQAHLRVIVSYSDVVDEQPEALYRAGITFHLVDEYADAAGHGRSMLSRVIRDFPDSEWADRARQGVPEQKAQGR